MASPETYKIWFENGGKEWKANYYKKYAASAPGRYKMYITAAKSRQLDFTLTLEEFTTIFHQPCTYCGESQDTRGIDRVDNTLPYTYANSVSCCKYCNYMKKDMTREQFISHVQKILTHQFNKK